MDDISKIRSDFYLKSKDNNFYKENKFHESLYRLTNFVDELFFNLIFQGTIDISNKQNSIRFSYMSIIKNIYRFIPRSNDEIDPNSLNRSPKSIIEEIEDATTFNRIRNSFDRLKTGTMKAEIIDDILCFNLVNIRNINSDLYSRWVDHQKPFLLEKSFVHDSVSRSFKDLFEKQYNKLWDNFDNIPKNRYKSSMIYNNCYQRLMDELLDIKEDISFTEFSLDEFRRVFSAIQTLSIIKTNNYIYKVKSKIKDTHNPSVLMKYNIFVEYVSDLSNVEIDSTIKIIELLIYDESFHEDKVSIYQPIFKSNGYIFFSTMLVYYSLSQDKILYYLNKMKNNQQALSKVAHLREKLMIDKIKDFILKNSNLQISDSYTLYENGISSAEYDIVILDTVSKSVLVCELKWFIKNDGELDLLNIDKKLVESIKIRTNRLKKFIDKKDEIIKNLFNIEIDEEYEIFGCIISENHSGSANIEDRMAIFDRFAFYFSLDSVGYNLREFHNIILDDDYLPIPPNEIEYVYFEYHGQRYRCPVLNIKID